MEVEGKEKTLTDSLLHKNEDNGVFFWGVKSSDLPRAVVVPGLALYDGTGWDVI